MENVNPISESVLDQYEILTPFDTDADVFLVKDRETKELFVEKTVYIHNPAIYEQIRDGSFEGVPRIYRIYSEYGKTILIEEYIHGLDLMQIVANKGPFPENEVASYMIRLCRILDQFHRMDPPVIHKDVKPGNLILTNESELYLIDFNISREFNPDSAIDTIAMVSPHFSAPEAYGFGQSDTRSDIYSIGATMHYLLTGGYLKETSYQGPLREIIERCTRMDPESRFQSVNELKEALQGYIDKNKYNSGYVSNGYGQDVRDIPSISSEDNHLSYLPPGFRQKKIWRMIVAVIVYALIAYICLTMKVESELKKPFSAVELWMERIGTFLFFIFSILILFDYRNWLDRIPGINRIPSRILRRILIIFILFSVILTVIILSVSVMSIF